MRRKVCSLIGGKCDAEAPAGHAQALDLLLDGHCQLLGSLLAQCAELASLLFIVLGEGG
ncbi:hypothetical protein D3C71_1851620 [compost metagenome]